MAFIKDLCKGHLSIKDLIWRGRSYVYVFMLADADLIGKVFLGEAKIGSKTAESEGWADSVNPENSVCDHKAEVIANASMVVNS